MAERKKIRRKRIPKPERPAALERCLSFSFKYLELDHTKFPLEACDSDFFRAFFREVERYQRTSVAAFMHPDPQEHRHPIVWPDTTEAQGFSHIDPQSEDVWTDAAWQFGIPNGAKGKPSRWRVHGFIAEAEATFYVVWFDPRHKLD